MKKIIIILVIIAIGAFGIHTLNNKDTSVKGTEIINEEVEVNDLGTFNSTDRESAVAQFAGKPTVIFVVGTFCPACQTAMPIYKTDIWDVYKDSVNIFANVIDGQSGKRFDVADIPQGLDPKLDYKTLVGNDCNYVPSWVMLDSEGVVTNSSCGANKGLDVIKADLDAYLNTQTETPETVELDIDN